MVMEQDRKEKAPVPAKVWAPAALEKEKAAAKDAAADKAKVKAKDGAKARVAARDKDRAVDRTSRLLFEKGA